MVLLTSSAKALQALLHVLSNFSILINFAYNTTKIVCMSFRLLSLSCLRVTKFQLNDQELDFVEEVKYLDHLIHETFNDESDIPNQLKKLNTNGNILEMNFGSCSNH